uniref:Uncharacterized protein n=1 Tax=Amphora coffeiformis TaxID=265554 RepID=A0A7S3LF56_9STRA|mmetsp:Transcript_9682/g.18512  ORF Transcript_9682/g.18512 Transcript_9682/m.18512 type:complete len:238 (+) Transcript_9682:148-861(+)
MPRQKSFLTIVLVGWAAVLDPQSVLAFSPATSLARLKTALAYSEDGQQDSAFDGSMKILNERLQQLRLEVLEKEVERPPNARLSACDFVKELLRCILENEDPLPESGFRVLLRTATDEWRDAIYHSVGAPPNASEDVVASALGEAIGRPDNQYALLVGEAEEYFPTFPFEPLDYFDGTAWVECRLRDKKDDSLLVSTGWQLQRNSEGAWMVAGMDWQDFREKFRPGVGRQEWMRVCD